MKKKHFKILLIGVLSGIAVLIANFNKDSFVPVTANDRSSGSFGYSGQSAAAYQNTQNTFSSGYDSYSTPNMNSGSGFFASESQTNGGVSSGGGAFSGFSTTSSSNSYSGEAIAYNAASGSSGGGASDAGGIGSFTLLTMPARQKTSTTNSGEKSRGFAGKTSPFNNTSGFGTMDTPTAPDFPGNEDPTPAPLDNGSWCIILIGGALGIWKLVHKKRELEKLKPIEA